MHEEHSKGNLFVKPDIVSEWGEFERVGSVFNLEDSVLMYLAEYEGRVVTLNEDIWSQLQNSDSYEISENDWDSVAKHAASVGRDYVDIKQKLENNSKIDAPIVMKNGEEYYLVSGNTRLMCARAFGMSPQILLFEVDKT